MDRLTPSESPRRKMSTQPATIDLMESEDENEDIDDVDKTLRGLDHPQKEDEAGARIDDIDALPELRRPGAIFNRDTHSAHSCEGSETDKPSFQSNAVGSSSSLRLNTSGQKALEILASARPESVAYMTDYYTRTEPLPLPQKIQVHPRPPKTVQQPPHPRRSGCSRCEANAYLLSLDGSPSVPLACSTDCLLDLDERKGHQTAYLSRMKKEFPGFKNPQGYVFKYVHLTKEQIAEIIDEDGLLSPKSQSYEEKQAKKRKMDDSRDESKVKYTKMGRTGANENLEDQAESYYSLKESAREKGDDGSL